MIRTQQRQYHVYKIASHALKLYESDVQIKQTINYQILDKSFQKKMNTAQLFKEIRHSKPLAKEREIETIIQASQNIRRLCNDAYELCRKVDMDERVEYVEDELVDFLELTNEMYPCVKKDLYHKVKLHIQSLSNNS